MKQKSYHAVVVANGLVLIILSAVVRHFITFIYAKPVQMSITIATMMGDE